MSTIRSSGKYWGYPAFRPLQEDIIHSVCAGRDTLGLMPTGGGKSVTFQVPALAMEGICFVITPLIALMRDQVDNLRRVGIKATGCIFGHGPAGNRCGIGELRFRTIQVPVRFARTACHRIIQGKATGHERLPVSGG